MIYVTTIRFLETSIFLWMENISSFVEPTVRSGRRDRFIDREFWRRTIQSVRSTFQRLTIRTWRIFICPQRNNIAIADWMPARITVRNPYPVPDVSSEGFWLPPGPVLGDKVSTTDRGWSRKLDTHDRLFAHHTLNSIRRDHRLVRTEVNFLLP